MVSVNIYHYKKYMCFVIIKLCKYSYAKAGAGFAAVMKQCIKVVISGKYINLNKITKI